jgi:hypothetical protein
MASYTLPFAKRCFVPRILRSETAAEVGETVFSGRLTARGAMPICMWEVQEYSEKKKYYKNNSWLRLLYAHSGYYPL